MTEPPPTTTSTLQSYYNSLSSIFTSTDKQPAPPIPSTVPCRFNLTTNTSSTFTLPDGRNLGYAQYGSQTGHAIFYLHGLPGSRIEAAVFDALGVKLDVRIIAPDRPGIGWSSPHHGRTLLDHAKDVEQLAKHLELEEYAVLGISGGGSYALACADALPPDKLKGVAVVCGLGPPDIGNRGMNWPNWGGFVVGYPYLPGLVRWFWKRDLRSQLHLSDEKRLELMRLQVKKSKLHEKDVATMHDDDILQMILQSGRQHFKQGFEGTLQDGKLICTDFGFKVEGIRKDLPVQLWYGELDTFVPIVHGRQITARLGGGAQLIVKDETHTSLVANWREGILRELVKSMGSEV